jgi:hypothetical protein
LGVKACHFSRALIYELPRMSLLKGHLRSAAVVDRYFAALFSMPQMLKPRRILR